MPSPADFAFDSRCLRSTSIQIARNKVPRLRGSVHSGIETVGVDRPGPVMMRWYIEKI